MLGLSIENDITAILFCTISGFELTTSDNNELSYGFTDVNL